MNIKYLHKKKAAYISVLIALIFSCCFTFNIFALKANANESENNQTEISAVCEQEDKTVFIEKDVLQWGASGTSGEEDKMPGWLIAVIIVCSVIIAGAVAAIIIMARMYSKSEEKDEKSTINPDEFYELKQELEQLKKDAGKDKK